MGIFLLPVWRKFGQATLGLVVASLSMSLSDVAVGKEDSLFASQLRAGEIVSVKDVIDGDTVVLTDGRQLRLVGIQAPKLPLGRKGFRAWPMAMAAKTALAALVVEERMQLYIGGRDTDRHGRLLAHMRRVTDGAWVQGEMLGRGMARVYSFADNRAAVTAMLRVESEARTAGRGIWALPYYQPRSHIDAATYINAFQLVWGRVKSVARVRGDVYLNFGDNWRDDFTIKVGARARRLFERENVDLMALQGENVEVRGWLRQENGPMIIITHPEQLAIRPVDIGGGQEGTDDLRYSEK
ncbi:MAG: nuclease (SNase) [Kordiimonas sp.]|nr:nuclease (SNase) [Kordiimonas sp.]